MKRHPDVGNLSLFDRKPIPIDGFRLKARTAVAHGRRPTFDQAVNSLIFAIQVEDSSPYWIGELWRYIKGQRLGGPRPRRARRDRPEAAHPRQLRGAGDVRWRA